VVFVSSACFIQSAVSGRDRTPGRLRQPDALQGFGQKAPTHAANRAASCPPPPQNCDAVSGLLNPQPNPNVLYGALVEGALFSDAFQDVRILNSTRIMIEHNAGFQVCHSALSRALPARVFI